MVRVVIDDSSLNGALWAFGVMQVNRGGSSPFSARGKVGKIRKWKRTSTCAEDHRETAV